MAVIQFKTKGFDKVEPKAQSGAEAGDIPGVGGNFRLEQHYFHVFLSGWNSGIGIAYITGSGLAATVF